MSALFVIVLSFQSCPVPQSVCNGDNSMVIEKNQIQYVLDNGDQHSENSLVSLFATVFELRLVKSVFTTVQCARFNLSIMFYLLCLTRV